MSFVVLEEWPDCLRNNGIVASDLQQAREHRCAALRKLRTALDEDLMDNALRDQILSLAASLVCVGQDCMIENEATNLVGPTVRFTAGRVTSHYPGRAARECQDEAETTTWLALKTGSFRRENWPFEAWCRRVLFNDVKTRLRKKDLLLNAKAIGVDPPADDLQAAIDEALDPEFRMVPFTEQDMKTIEGWTLNKRIVLLCLLGLWPKVPDARWESWVTEVDAETPFPQIGFAELETAGQRQQWLAAALRLSEDVVTQIWYRGRKHLADLQCIRRLRS